MLVFYGIHGTDSSSLGIAFVNKNCQGIVVNLASNVSGPEGKYS